MVEEIAIVSGHESHVLRLGEISIALHTVSGRRCRLFKYKVINMNIRKVYSHEDVYYDSDCTVDISRSKNIGAQSKPWI